MDLLTRCLVAYDDAADDLDTLVEFANRQCMAAVLAHLAAEIIVMHQREPRLGVHELARLLTLEAASELADWANDDDHPSLTAEERNPDLR